MKTERVPRIRSLRHNLLSWLLTPLLALLILSAIAAYGIALNFARDAFDRSLYESAYDIAQLVRKSAIDGQPPFNLPREARELILSDQYDETYYNIRDEKDALLSGEKSLAPPPLAVGKHKLSLEGVFYDAIMSGKPVRVASRPFILEENGESHRINIQVAETLNKRSTLSRQILTGLILPQLLLVILAGGIVWFSVGRGLRPLQRLEESVAARSHLDLRPLHSPEAPAEAQPLIRAINALLERLERVLNAQNRFIADAAHQLRTPLAGLKAQIALASRQKTLEDAQLSLNQLEIGAERLTHLVNQLLSIARNEPGADRSVNMQPLDLNALAQEVTGEWLNIAVKRDIDLGFEGCEHSVWVLGDQLRINELLNNLIDNALRYTHKGGSITVRVTESGILEVEDNGPGIPKEERERVFERFHRLLGNEAEGSGLGLAIVKEIADMHNASVTIYDGSPQGALFRVSFPSRL